MENCPKCNEKLNIDEKLSGRCFSCGATFSSPLPKDDKKSVPYISANATDNTVAKIIKVLGIVIIILGTIGNIIMNHDHFSLSAFLEMELSCAVSGMFFVGLAEIIKLLEEIKNK